jgi:hypothetical protein
LEDLHQNQFGGAAGGPVLLPHYNGKDRTFFYGSYEGFRQTIGAVQQQLVPTAAQLNGDFSNLLAKGRQLYNPFTANRDPFPNNQIPANMIDQKMVALAQAIFPAATGSYLGGIFNYQSAVPSTHTSDQYDIRGDEYLTKKDLVWAHFLRQNNPIGSYGGFPKLATVTSFTAHNFGAQWIHTFGPTSILTVGVGQNIGPQFHNTTYNGDGNGIATAAGFAQSFACDYPYGRKGCYIPSLSLGSILAAVKVVRQLEAFQEFGNTRQIFNGPSGGIPSMLEVTSTPTTWAGPQEAAPRLLLHLLKHPTALPAAMSWRPCC